MGAYVLALPSKVIFEGISEIGLLEISTVAPGLIGQDVWL